MPRVISGTCSGALVLLLATCVLASPVAALAGSSRDFLLARERDNLLHADIVTLGIVDLISDDTSTRLGSGPILVGLSVERVIKGPPLDSLEFRGAGPGLAGSARFKPGERVIVFLTWSGNGAERFLRCLMADNKYAVTADDELAPAQMRAVWPNRSLGDFVRDAAELLDARQPASLFKSAQLVVIADVLSSRERGGEEHLPPGRRQLLVRLGIEETLKGNAALSEVTVLPPVPVGDIYDFAEFRAGERVLVFLDRRSDGRWSVAGCHDGKHRLGDFTTSHVLGVIRGER